MSSKASSHLTLSLKIAKVGLGEQRLRDANEELVDRAQQLGKLAEKLTFTEQYERQRLAQILHDGLQQILVAAKYRVTVAARSKNAHRELEQVTELIDDAIGTSRSLTAELSPPILLQGDLFSALEWLARWMREKHQLNVSLVAYEKLPPMAEGLLLLLFQAIRELLFNVVKHAGVRAASVTVNRLDGQILMTIEDKGSGFDPGRFRSERDQSGGMGLFGISERLSSELLTYPGGKLSTFSQTDGSETENLRRSLVPGKMVSVLFSASHTRAIALERWGELSGERFTSNSCSFGSMDAELRRAVWISVRPSSSVLA